MERTLLEDLLTGRQIEVVLDRNKIKLLGDFRVEENRMGIKMDPFANVARKAILFNRPYWKFRTNLSLNTKELVTCGIKAWFSVLEEPPSLNAWDGVGFLGWDRGRARFEFSMIEQSSDPPLCDLKKNVQDAADDSEGFFCIF